jgi:hypothetical protein
MNLGRLLLKQGKVQAAGTELKWALGVDTRYAAADQDLHRVPGMLN